MRLTKGTLFELIQSRFGPRQGRVESVGQGNVRVRLLDDRGFDDVQLTFRRNLFDYSQEDHTWRCFLD